MLGRLARRKLNGAQRQRLVEHLTGADFIPIVILRIDPEDRDARNLMGARDLSRELERRQRLEQGERRTAEQSSLLTRDDGDGLRIRELLACGHRARRRGAAALLIGDDRGNLGAPAAVRLRPPDRVSPGRGIGWIAGKKRRDRWKIESVIGRQTPDPREAADVDAER